jgi:hypothetical protein
MHAPTRIVAVRQRGTGYQYELQYPHTQETAWVASSRVRREQPALVAAFEAEQAQQAQRTQADAPQPEPDVEHIGGAEAAAEAEGSPNPGAEAHAPGMLAADGSSMMAQLEALQRLVQEQAQQLAAQRARPANAPSMASSSPPPMASPSSPATVQSRFARKEPRAQDLREYEGAAGSKLDEWLQELEAAADLYELNAREACKFGVSRMRGTARQWWLSLGAGEKQQLTTLDTLAAALRARFQPITTAETARAQMDALRQGARHVNEYIAEFQRLSTQIGAELGAGEARHAFLRGLRADIAEKLRVAGVDSLSSAIAMAARIGTLTAAAAGAQRGNPSGAAVYQMDAGGYSAAQPSLDERLADMQAALNALQSQQAYGTVPQTQRSFPPFRGGRGGQAGRGGRSAGGSSSRPLPAIPGVPADVIRQRWDARLCLRCGDDGHRAVACPNALSAQPKNE